MSDTTSVKPETACTAHLSWFPCPIRMLQLEVDRFISFPVRMFQLAAFTAISSIRRTKDVSQLIEKCKDILPTNQPYVLLRWFNGPKEL